MANIVAICAYFNPAGYKSKRVNYLRFRKNIIKYGIKLITVELYFENSELCGISDVVSIKNRGISFQKENVLNYGLSILPSNTEIVLLLDADIELSQEIVENLNKMENSRIYQLFSHVEREGPLLKNDRSQGFAYKYLTKGSVSTVNAGFAWGGKIELVNKIKLFDECLVGSGDVANALGFICNHKNIRSMNSRIKNEPFYKSYSVKFKKRYLEWINFISTKINGIGYIPGLLTTYYHGKAKDRNYVNRHLLFYKKDPIDYVLRNENKIYEVSNELVNSKINMYFINRNEDGDR